MRGSYPSSNPNAGAHPSALPSRCRFANTADGCLPTKLGLTPNRSLTAWIVPRAFSASTERTTVTPLHEISTELLHEQYHLLDLPGIVFVISPVRRIISQVRPRSNLFLHKGVIRTVPAELYIHRIHGERFAPYARFAKVAAAHSVTPCRVRFGRCRFARQAAQVEEMFQ